MDGLASLAAAADLVGFADIQPSPSPLKRKLSQQAPRTPTRIKKKRENEIKDEKYENELTPQPSPAIDIVQSTRGDPLADKIIRTLNPSARLWCAREWFYSTLDRDYFVENEFLSCLHQLGLGKITKLKRADWTRVRSVMSTRIGRARRFSVAFLRGEREKLSRYRRIVRRMQLASIDPSSNATLPPPHEFPYQVLEPVEVGDVVTVLHTQSCSLQRGQVLAVNTWSEHAIDFIVQFDQVELGHGIVSDDMIAAHGVAAVLYGRRRAAEVAVGGGGDRGGAPLKEDEGQGEANVLLTDQFFARMQRSEQFASQSSISGSQKLFVNTEDEEGCVGGVVGGPRSMSDSSTLLGQDRGSLQSILEQLWHSCIEEAESFVLTRVQKKVISSGSSSGVSDAQMTGSDLLKVPAMASLFFLRLRETDHAVQEEAGRRRAAGEELDADVIVSSFLASKMALYYEPGSDLTRKLALLFGLVNSLSRGDASSRTLLEQAHHRAQFPDQYHLQGHQTSYSI